MTISTFFNFKAFTNENLIMQYVFEDTNSQSTRMDMTGMTAVCVMKNIRTDETVLSLTTDDDTITLGGSAGTLTLNVPKESMAVLTDAMLTYDILLTNVDVSKNVIHGTIELIKGTS